MTLHTRNMAELLKGLQCRWLGESDNVEVEAIVTDSRQAGPGRLFVAMPGLHVDGHSFVEQAMDNGCLGAVVEQGRGLERLAGPDRLIIEVAECREALAKLASEFYGQPADSLTMVGITGTNGKTTTTYLLEAIIRQAGGNPGVIGTINYRFNGLERPAPFTTPEPVLLHGLLREMVDGGVTHLIMEVSSHGLAQKRLGELKFHVGVFTNLSRDHLDFHNTMEEYFQAKSLLFTCHLFESGKAVVVRENGIAQEGDWGERLLTKISEQPGVAEVPVSCGMASENHVHPTEITYGLAATTASLATPAGAIQVDCPLVGEFNLKNIMGAVASALALGVGTNEIEKGLAKVGLVPGRLERVGHDMAPAVYVDYAHTPEALEKVLLTVRALNPRRVIVVFGCGGDRDPGKRPLMGEAAGRLADLVIITSDNSRSESLEKIMADIERGLLTTGMKNIEVKDLEGQHRFNGHGTDVSGYLLCSCRRQAIKLAIRAGGMGDLVLINGKGHETYQIDSQGTAFFDDRLEAQSELTRING